MSKQIIMPVTWGKEEYLAWLARRSANAAEWNLFEAAKADEAIKHATLNILREKVAVLPEPMRQWAIDMASFTFGSVETDAMLTDMDCYPDWMEKAELEDLT